MNMQHQTIFFEIQAFPTEKNRFLSVFFISKKSQRCSKKARISKPGFKKAKLTTLDLGGKPSNGCLLKTLR